MQSILILGNPNSGKSLLFNKLTGLRQKVANFPGVTVEIRSGESDGLLFQDFPGIYSLSPITKDERVAVEGFESLLQNSSTQAILCVLDATRLERSLYLLLQLIPKARAHGRPLIAVVNIIDEIRGNAKIQLQELQKELQIPVLGVSAKTEEGLGDLRQLLKSIQPVATVQEETSDLKTLKEKAKKLSKDFGPQVDVILKNQNRLDSFFLSHFFGPIMFTILMVFLFQSIFTWAKPFMDLTSAAIDFLGERSAQLLGPGMLADLSKDALFAGVGSFLVFAPQIFILFVVIGVLEDSGYLARAAIILHRPLGWFGLSGRSFVPLLSGHACALPAIMATRTIESPRKRLLTMIAIPFMSCSARLPVYALLIGSFVPATTYLGGSIGLQGLAFFGLFALGIITGLLASGLIDFFARSSKKEALQDAPFIVELPPYRIPSFRPIFRQSLSRTYGFIKNAGFVIFTVTAIIWALGYFPNGQGHLDTSYMGSLGRFIEPLFTPMGMDWKVGVGVLVSFLAREVFVATLGTLYGLENVDEQTSALTERLHASGMTLASAIALLVFYALAMQCVSTLAVVKKETGSSKLPIAIFVGMTLLAYGAASLSYLIFR